MIRLENVSLKLNGNPVLQNLSFHINEGEKVQLTGRSGSGKSTFLKLLLGFVRPDEGRIYYRNEQVTSKNIWRIRQSMAYVSQDIRLGEGTVRDFFRDIQSYKLNHHLPITPSVIKEKLYQFHLHESAYEQELSTLSGGEAQRIAIIAALLLDRVTYLLDEVTSALDPELKNIVAAYFMNLQGKTVLYISHDEVWSTYKHKNVNLGTQPDL